LWIDGKSVYVCVCIFVCVRARARYTFTEVVNVVTGCLTDYACTYFHLYETLIVCQTALTYMPT